MMVIYTKDGTLLVPLAVEHGDLVADTVEEIDPESPRGREVLRYLQQHPDELLDEREPVLATTPR